MIYAKTMLTRHDETQTKSKAGVSELFLLLGSGLIDFAFRDGRLRLRELIIFKQMRTKIVIIKVALVECGAKY